MVVIGVLFQIPVAAVALKIVVVAAILTATLHVLSSPTNMALATTPSLGKTPVVTTGRDSVRAAGVSYPVVLVTPIPHHVLAQRVVRVHHGTVVVMVGPVQRVATVVVLTTAVGYANGSVLAKELKCYQEKE